VRLALASLVVLVPALASAQDTLAGSFADANAAYARGEFEVAARGYERLVESGVEDGDVFYDLGLSYARLGQHGRAVAAFERALSVRPGDAEALAALESSRGILGRRRAEREGEAYVDAGPPTLEGLYGWASENTLAVLLLLFEALLALALGSLFFVKAERPRIALGIIAPVSALGLAFAAVGLSARTGALDPGAAAIVVREGAPMREGPSGDASVRHEALEGERVYVTAEDGDFSRIQAGSRAGWIASGDLVVLR
jgi:tetratricopeptide (TPR) repeat protein